LSWNLEPGTWNLDQLLATDPVLGYDTSRWRLESADKPCSLTTRQKQPVSIF